MRHINSNSFCIASLEPPPLETLLYFTALFYTKSIIFFKITISPFSHSVKERLLRALFNIINIKKKHITPFNISLSISFNLGLLPRRIPYYLLTASILYQDFRCLILYIGAT